MQRQAFRSYSCDKLMCKASTVSGCVLSVRLTGKWPKEFANCRRGIGGILRTNTKAAGIEELILESRQITIRHRRIHSSKEVEMFVRNGCERKSGIYAAMGILNSFQFVKKHQSTQMIMS